MACRISRLLPLSSLALALLLGLGCARLNFSSHLAGPPLHFRADGTFKIVTFGDIHWDRANERDRRTLKLMDRIVETEKPDLVIYTGDNCISADAASITGAYRDLTAPAVKRGIPWAAALGNHDGEFGHNRREHYEIILHAPGTVTRRGPKNIYGFSNYVLPIASAQGGRARALLYILDSNAYHADKDLSFYDWIRPDQVQWYLQTAARYKQANHGAVLPAYAFFHIPLQEYELFWQKGKHVGDQREEIYCPRVNSGLWAAILEAGDIKGVFVGHSHLNDFIAGYHGLWLGFVRGVGFNGYGDDPHAFKRGARVIELREGQRAFKTWLHLEGDEIVHQTLCD